MPSHTRRLPLALSLAFHGLALAALCHFAPRSKPAASEFEPLSVRFVERAPVTHEESVEPAPALDRRLLPPEPDLAAAPAPAPSAEEFFAELPAETFSFATEVPASAPRSVIGAGVYGFARLPRGPAAAAVAPAAPVAGPDCSIPPEPLDCPAPEYPAGSATVSESGKVRLSITLGTDGRVEGVRILHSSGFARLDEAAEHGVEHWRFRPALRAGSPVRWTLEHTIVFRVAGARG